MKINNEYNKVGDYMEKDLITSSHNLNLISRKSINITGVKKIDNFSENEFILETIMGFMIIKGANLEIIKLDTQDGNVSIKGKIDSIVYTDKNKKQKNEGILDKLFK